MYTNYPSLIKLQQDVSSIHPTSIQQTKEHPFPPNGWMKEEMFPHLSMLRTFHHYRSMLHKQRKVVLHSLTQTPMNGEVPLPVDICEMDRAHSPTPSIDKKITNGGTSYLHPSILVNRQT